jgi:hypothetical protein
MGSLPEDKAGVGSAVNDTTRQIGGALGVAILGSIVSSGYADRLAGQLNEQAPGRPVPEAALDGIGAPSRCRPDAHAGRNRARRFSAKPASEVPSFVIGPRRRGHSCATAAL